MQSGKGLACALGAAMVVSACAGYARTAASPPSPPRAQTAADPRPRNVAVASSEELGRLIAYASRLRFFSPVVLRSELAAAQKQHRDAPSAYTQLKLAALISAHRAPFRDDLRAREYLVAAEAGAHGAMRDLAALWLQQLDERIALERALHDERRARHTAQKKLEQLKTIEEEIDRRPSTPVVPSR